MPGSPASLDAGRGAMKVGRASDQFGTFKLRPLKTLIRLKLSIKFLTLTLKQFILSV